MAKVIIEVEGERTEFEMGLAQIIKLARVAYELQDGKGPGAEREVVGRYQPPNGKAWNLESDAAESGS